ncbi:MAG: hypothetical protein AAF533_01770 [Acidobacteriota bacterium]
MTLPTKGSRRLVHDGTAYRWLLTSRQDLLHLTVELDEEPGQVLRAFFEPHDQYRRGEDRRWSFHRQGREVTPSLVSRVVGHGLANGWEPAVRGKPPLEIYTWQVEDLPKVETSEDEVALREIAAAEVTDLLFDISTDAAWRQRLFDAPVHQRISIPEEELSRRVRGLGLRFAVFNDGWLGDGFVVFGIESVDFSHVVMYTTNNASII